MSLPDVLSALRTTIMDTPELPDSVEARFSFYKKAFPGMTDEEAQDFAAILPEKLKVYSVSIFAQHRSFFRRRFPVSAKLLERIWPEVYNSKFNPTEFVKRIHKIRTWRSTVTLDLAQCIADFIVTDLDEITSKYPILKELAQFELATLKVDRAFSGPYSAKDSIDKLLIAKLTVDELMARSFVVPSYVLAGEFGFDLVSLRTYFFSHGRSLPEALPSQNEVFALCGRDKPSDPCWSLVSKEDFEFIAALERDKPIEVALFAEKFIENQPESSEEELFSLFLKQLIELSDNGIIVLR